MEETKKSNFWKDHWGTILMAAFVVVFAGTLFLGLWKPVVVHQTSMYPTLQPGDYLFIVRTGRYERGDIVVFNSETLEQGNLIKRVVALGGDHLRIVNGQVWLNDELLQEEYLQPGLLTEGEVDLVLNEGECFLMGDNRTVSIDCRAFGPVEEDDILGEVNLRVFHQITLF